MKIVRSFCQKQFVEIGEKTELSEKLSERERKKESGPRWSHSSKPLKTGTSYFPKYRFSRPAKALP